MRPAIIGLMAFAAGCSQQPSETVSETPSDVAATAPSEELAETGTAYSAPGDPNATYSLLSVKPGKGGNIIAMTRRTGSSGVSYSNREIDCEAQLARYIGEGDSLDEAEKLSPNPGSMAPLVEGSSTHAAVQAACASR